MEETPEGEHSDAGITAAMRAIAKTKAASYKGKFSKYTAVANPKLGNQFLEVVIFLYLLHHHFYHPLNT
jgi:hypothetical protein